MNVVVVPSEQIDTATSAELRRLWDRAFGERFSDDDADHAYGGVHVLARDGGVLIGHAAAVTRSIKFGDGPWRTIGYVEAVAVDPARQGEGVGRRLMNTLGGLMILRIERAAVPDLRVPVTCQNRPGTAW